MGARGNNGSTGGSTLTLALALVAVLLLPLAQADGSFETEVLVVEVANGFDEGCAPSILGFCLVDVETNRSVSDWNIDGYQRFDYVGVAVTPLEPLVSRGIDPLGGSPRVEHEIQGSEVMVANPVIPPITEAWAQLPLVNMLPDRLGVHPSEENITFRYYGVTGWDGSTRLPLKEWVIVYNREKNIGYDRLGPVNNQGGTSGDEQMATLEREGCGAARKPPGCDRALRVSARFVDAVTPNASYGFELYEVEAATDAGLLEENALREAVERLGSPSLLDPVKEAAGEGVPPPEEGTFLLENGASPGPGFPLPPRGGSEHLPPPAQGQASRKTQATPLASTLGGAAVPEAPPHLLGLLAAAGLGLVWAWSLFYSRITSRREALASARRQRLADLVKARPGISWKEAAELLGVTRNGLGHHVDVLARSGLLTVVEARRNRFLFPADGAPVKKVIPPLVRSPVQARILALLDAAPGGLSRAALHAALDGTPERTRRDALARLLFRGLVREEECADGESRLVRAATAAEFPHRLTLSP
ncbi:MAG TPA: helix-turn-helix domain-containing protein [Candidatus Thermoplasmatota archaeon]|nr:helix-turn-helix domain-containing protein [Candidatus Thermoplasmatota archaeon]